MPCSCLKAAAHEPPAEQHVSQPLSAASVTLLARLERLIEVLNAGELLFITSSLAGARGTVAPRDVGVQLPNMKIVRLYVEMITTTTTT